MDHGPRPTRPTSPILIIGGGIGGLAAAIALERAGFEAMVFERAPDLHEVGAGLSLWSNAVQALDRLGLRDAVLERSATMERAVTLTSEGDVLTDVSLLEVERELGQPSICAHRADLQRVLAAAMRPGVIHLGVECTGIETDGSGVTARFAGEGSVRGTLAVGADGIHSILRATLHGESRPRYAGYFAFRGIARTAHPDLPPGTGKFVLGRGAQVGFMHCGGGRIYWFATVNAPEATGIAANAKRQWALTHFRAWLPLVTDVIAATPEEAILVNDIVDRPVIREWGRGRTTLLGDAAHPTTPNLGQGGCQALEDAVVLAASLREHGVGEDALRRYENARRAHTAMIQRQSWWLGKVFQLESPLGIRLRNRLIRTRFGQRQATSSLRSVLQTDLPPLNAAQPSSRR